MAIIYLVRHGETALNAEDRLRGWTNPSLNEDGVNDAKKLAAKFKGIELDRVYSSDLKRAQQTAQAISKVTHDKLILTDKLRPINFGRWNGAKLSEIKKPLTELHAKWKTDPKRETPYSDIHGAESFDNFQARMIQIFEKILKDCKPNDAVAIVAHLRNCMWIKAYVAQGRQPLKGDDLDLLDPGLPGPTINQKTSDATIFDYDVAKDECKLAKNQEIKASKLGDVMMFKLSKG